MHVTNESKVFHDFGKVPVNCLQLIKICQRQNKENFIYIGLDEWETINIQKIEYKQQEVNKLEQ